MGDSGHRETRRQSREAGETMPNLKNRKGQGLVEYILLVVVMGLLAIGGIRVLGKNTHNAFVQASDTLDDDMQTAASDGVSNGRIR